MTSVTDAIVRTRGPDGRFLPVEPDELEADVGADLPPLRADRFLDREISWLRFNERVLELAEDELLGA